MYRKKKKLICYLMTLLLFFCIDLSFPQKAETVQAASNGSKIHFLTLQDNTDAILLECNGKFGMVDSGEDSDYPSGKDSRYPFREGTVKRKGFEGEVVSYMHSVGVTKNNFEFYIGTHPHSDHIGTADEVINEFHPKRVYIEKYSDSDITESSHLWDNLYVYDHMITAAKDTGATLIQAFRKDAPLYPETVTLRGTILFPKASEEKPEEDTNGENITDEDSGPDAEISGDDTKFPNGDVESPSEDTEVPDNNAEVPGEDTEVPDNNAEVPGEDEENPDNNEEPSQQILKSPDNTFENDSPTDSNVTANNTDYNAADNETPSVSSQKTADQNQPQADASEQVASPELDTDEPSVPSNNISDLPAEKKVADISPQVQTPESLSITVSYSSKDKDTDIPKPVTISSTDSISESGSITKVSENLWTYELKGLQKYDNTKSDFQLSITVSANGYTFSQIDGATPYDFQGESTSVNTTPAYAAEENDLTADKLTDDSEIAEIQENSGTDDETLETPDDIDSDNMTTTDIPATDQVDPDHPDNAMNSKAFSGAAPAQSGIYEDEIGAESTPVFYLGGKNGMKLEIMNYGVTRPKPDANYFSLGVKVTSVSTGKTAFLSGDINNFNGTETRLAGVLGHVDVLKLGHHGSYGSNTYTYLKTLSPSIAIMTGKFDYVSNNKVGAEIGTLDTLLQMSKSGMELYPTACYASFTRALVINLDKKLSNNIPKNKSIVAVTDFPSPNIRMHYRNGFPSAYTGWAQSADKNWYYFENSRNASFGKWIKNSAGQYYYLKPNGIMAIGWVVVDNHYYYMDSTGVMTTGWQKDNGKWYYMDSSGQMLTGRQRIGLDYYYFFPSGAMAVDQYVSGQYYDSSGKWSPNFTDSNWMQNSSGYWYRFADGSYPKNTWLSIHGTWYYFNSSGYMATGWLKDNGKWYYLGTDGAMKTGWWEINGTWYYLNGSGAMLTGLQTLGGQKYYFNTSGAMLTGWCKLKTKWYYFQGNGAAATGWYQVGTTWYYSNGAGQMLTGWISSGGTYYYLTGSGAMATGWLHLGNTWYYLNSSGAMQTGWIELGGTWYYLDRNGFMLTGLRNINGAKYYLSASGSMLTGWVSLNSKWYYFNSNGAAAVGWNFINDSWYYLNHDGVMVTGLQNINGTKYYLDGSGAMRTGWLQLSNKWYYFNINGAALSGWNYINDAWYYLDTSGVMMTGLQTIKGQKYYLDASGAMQTGWLQLSGKWYYFNSNGAAAAGWNHINGAWYYLSPKTNIMASGTWTPDGYYVNGNGAWTGQKR